MTLKFIVDVGVGKKVETWLAINGYDVSTVRAINPGLPDLIILQIAANEGRVVITMDKDFGEMVYHAKLPHAGVLLLRLEDASGREKAMVIAKIMEDYADKLEGRFSVYRSGRLRIRRV